jgi:hypothetical protein
LAKQIDGLLGIAHGLARLVESNQCPIVRSSGMATLYREKFTDSVATVIEILAR